MLAHWNGSAKGRCQLMKASFTEHGSAGSRWRASEAPAAWLVAGWVALSGPWPQRRFSVHQRAVLDAAHSAAHGPLAAPGAGRVRGDGFNFWDIIIVGNKAMRVELARIDERLTAIEKMLKDIE